MFVCVSSRNGVAVVCVDVGIGAGFGVVVMGSGRAEITAAKPETMTTILDYWFDCGLDCGLDCVCCVLAYLHC